MSLLLSMLLLQAAPMVSQGAAPPIRESDIFQGRDKKRDHPPEAPQKIESTRLQLCLDKAPEDAETTTLLAAAWLKQAKGSARAEPLLCLGTAQALQDDWAEAEASFLAGRDVASATDKELRARLGAMAGNAALALDAHDRALKALAPARLEAKAIGDNDLATDIALDQARALVALKREEEAAPLLAEARTMRPDDAGTWLLSAALSRRQNKLAEAQSQIEKAASLKPTDPDIGLEAGVIAMMSGRSEAARKGWQSVIAVAPDSEAATAAKGYLTQLEARTPTESTKPH